MHVHFHKARNLPITIKRERNSVISVIFLAQIQHYSLSFEDPFFPCLALRRRCTVDDGWNTSICWEVLANCLIDYLKFFSRSFSFISGCPTFLSDDPDMWRRGHQAKTYD